MNREELKKQIAEGGVLKKSYFVQVENSFILNPKYTVTEKMMYQALCTFAGKDVSCFPSQLLLAASLGISRTTVNQTLKSLEEKGGLIKVSQKTETNRKTACLYILAEIDKKTGDFDPESLDTFRSLIGEVLTVQETMKKKKIQN